MKKVQVRVPVCNQHSAVGQKAFAEPQEIINNALIDNDFSPDTKREFDKIEAFNRRRRVKVPHHQKFPQALFRDENIVDEDAMDVAQG